MDTNYAIIVGVYLLFALITWYYYPKNQSKFALFVFICLVAMTIAVIPPLSKHTIHITQNTLNSIKYEPTVHWRSILLPVHIILAIPCTLFGPFLIFAPFRNKFRGVHRTLGKIYVLCTLVSAILVLPLALTNSQSIENAWVGQSGFSIMAVLWFAFTMKAYTAIMEKRVAVHKAWMMRSYAMTFAFVHVNVTYGLINAYAFFNYDPIAAKVLQSYASWAFNLIIVEIYLRRKQLFKRPKKLEVAEAH